MKKNHIAITCTTNHCNQVKASGNLCTDYHDSGKGTLYCNWVEESRSNVLVTDPEYENKIWTLVRNDLLHPYLTVNDVINGCKCTLQFH